MADETEIVNAVAALLAGEQVDSRFDSNKIAVKVNQRWNLDRDASLRAHPWNFATRLISAAEKQDAPAFGFARRFALSTDPYVLRVWSLSAVGVAWRVIGREIHTDAEAPLKYEAVVRVEDPLQWDPLFADHFATVLAANIAFDMTGSITSYERFMKMAERKAGLARSIDGQEDGRDPVDRSGGILASRTSERWP